MGTIRLDYPTALLPTASVVLNPVFATVQPFKRTAFQRRLVSEDGTAYLYVVSANVENQLEMLLTDLHELDDTDGFSGVASLLTFFDTTVQYGAAVFDLTDADGVVTAVRLWSPTVELREAEGQVRVQGRFSGQLLFRKEL